MSSIHIVTENHRLVRADALRRYEARERDRLLLLAQALTVAGIFVGLTIVAAAVAV